MTELPVKPDEKKRLRMVTCPMLHCEVSLGKCYKCRHYRGRGEAFGQALVICAAPPVEKREGG
ncbi:MAG: hypothetical protein ABIG98_01065 [Chloroflexota bacterium]